MSNNVKAGVAVTDAANVGQVQTAQTTAITASNAYTDGKTAQTLIDANTYTDLKANGAAVNTDKLGTTTAAAIGGGAAYNPATGAISAPTINAAGKTLTNATDGIQALDKQTVQYGTNADGTVDYTAAALLGKGGTQISNVKAGALPNDAANTQQVVDGVTEAKTYAKTQDAILGTSTAAGLGGGSAYDAVTGKVTAPTIKAAGKTLTNATDGIQALDKQTVQYGTNPDGTVDYTAAALLGKGGTQISNVKAGTLPNDAANTQQVADGVTEAKTYSKTQDAILGTSTAAGLGGGSVYDAVTGKVTAPTIKAAGKTLTNATDGIQALDKQTVQYGTNPDGTVDYTAAALLGKGGTQISNVKAGTLPNDAANTQQVADGVTTAKTYADTRSLAAEQNAIKSSNGYTDTQLTSSPR